LNSAINMNCAKKARNSCFSNTRAEHFRSGPVLDQNIQPNWFYFIFSFGTEPKTSSNRLILVRFGSVFSPSKSFQTEIFILASIFQKINSNFYTCFHFPKNQLQFSFCSSCPEVKPSKKIHKTKGFDCKKTKRKSKVIEM